MDGVQPVGTAQGGLVEQRREHGQRGVRPARLAHGDRVVEGDDRTGRQVGEHAVEDLDLGPVGGGRGAGLGVHGRDGRLELVRADRAVRQRALDERDALVDEVAPPQRAVLLRQRDQRPRRVETGRPPRVGEQHQREQPRHLGVTRQQVVQPPGEPDRLLRQ